MKQTFCISPATTAVVQPTTTYVADNSSVTLSKNKIILHIPHSSAFGVTDEGSGWFANQFFINEAVRDLTDWHTDMLFRTVKGYDDNIVFPYSRFCVDVERQVNDPMEAEGHGICGIFSQS